MRDAFGIGDHDLCETRESFVCGADNFLAKVALSWVNKELGFDRREVIMPIVPLGMQSKAIFEI